MLRSLQFICILTYTYTEYDEQLLAMIYNYYVVFFQG